MIAKRTARPNAASPNSRRLQIVRQQNPSAGYVRMPNSLHLDKRAGRIHILVYGAVAFHDHRNGQGCWASIKTIAKMARLGTTKTREALGDLVDWGYMTSELRANDTTRYFVTLPLRDLSDSDNPITS